MAEVMKQSALAWSALLCMGAKEFRACVCVCIYIYTHIYIVRCCSSTDTFKAGIS